MSRTRSVGHILATHPFTNAQTHTTHTHTYTVYIYIPHKSKPSGCQPLPLVSQHIIKYVPRHDLLFAMALNVYEAIIDQTFTIITIYKITASNIVHGYVQLIYYTVHRA